MSIFSQFFFFKQKTAYEMRISDWSSDVCSSDLRAALSEGQSLDTPNRLHYGMTPVHLACAKHSLNFIDEALKETFNAWARDLGGRLSMDYAIAEGLEDVAEMLLERLYPRDASGRPRMPF